MSSKHSQIPEKWIGTADELAVSPRLLRPIIEHPRTLFAAVCAMQQKDPNKWLMMAKDVFRLNRRQSVFLMYEAVVNRILDTGVCEYMPCDDQVKVWIDQKGVYQVTIYRS